MIQYQLMRVIGVLQYHRVSQKAIVSIFVPRVQYRKEGLVYRGVVALPNNNDVLLFYPGIPLQVSSKPTGQVVDPTEFSLTSSRDYLRNLSSFFFLLSVQLSFRSSNYLRTMSHLILLPFQSIGNHHYRFKVNRKMRIRRLICKRFIIQITRCRFLEILLRFRSSLRSFSFGYRGFSSFVEFGGVPYPFIPYPSYNVPSKDPSVPHANLP